MRSWQLVRPVRGSLVSGILLQTAGAIAGLVPMFALIRLVQTLWSEQDPERAWFWLWIALAGVGARLGLSGAGLLLTHFADASLNRSLRSRISEHLGRIPMGDAARHSSGRIKKLVTDDVNTLHSLVAHAGGDMATAIVTAIGALALLLAVSWPLAVLALLPLLGFVIVFGSLMGRASGQLTAYEDARGRVNAATIEFTRGISVVKTFGQTRRASAQFRSAVDDYARFFGSWMGPMISASALALALVSVPSVVALMTVGGLAMLGAGWIGVPELAAGIILGIGIAQPLTQMESYSVRLRSGREAATRITTFLATPAQAWGTAPVRISEDASSTDASFDDVAFRYDADAPLVLDGADLRLTPGTVTGLVGASGAGKSTLASLLPRFWDPGSGTVSVGGTDVAALDQRTLFRTVGFLFQRSHLVPLSVRDNIRLSRPDADDAAVVAAAVAARIDERIRALPRGYDSVPGVDASFSGGEAQRLALARTFLDDTPILVLDEPTSYADPENEILLQQAMSTAMAGRTVVVIAHRLHTIAGADLIAVIADRRVAEVGSHSELLERGGTYALLWNGSAESEGDPR